MYNGEIEMVFDDLVHRYSINGKKIKSVTGILGVISKPYLIPWAAKVTVEKMSELFKPGTPYDEIEIKQMLDTSKRAHFAIKTTAADIGTLVHKYLEQYIKGEKPEELVHEQARKATERFINWVEKNKVKFLLSEQMVYSRKYDYCGTLDFVCVINGKLMLGDIKTSNQISKIEYGAQMAAYKMARNEEFPEEKYQGMVLIRVGKKDAEFEHWEIGEEETKIYEDIFLNSISLKSSIDKVEVEK